MPAVPAPESTLPHPAEAASLDARLTEVEAFNAHVSGMVESLVDTLLHVRNHEMQALQRRVGDLEQVLHAERCHRDLADVSRRHPKERTVVFVGGSYFGDNVKYAWLAANARASALGVQVWYLPPDAAVQAEVEALGGRCLPPTHHDWSADHVHTALSAAVVVLGDHLLSRNPYAAALLAGARALQMWHGVSIKELGYRNLVGLKDMSPQTARVLATCGPFARFVGTAVHQEAEWRRWFSFDRYAAAGYPRNDVLCREPAGHDLVNVDADAYAKAGATLAAGRRVFLYAPTVRDAQRGDWLRTAGLGEVADAVAARGDRLLVNLHPLEQGAIPELAAALPQVDFVRARSDIYPLLTRTSALITDYSSLLFDYLLLDRPVVLFRPDHTAYTTHSRTLFDQKLANPPGPLVTTSSALAGLLSGPLDDAGDGALRRRLRDGLFDHQDGHAADRLLELLAEEVSLATRADGASGRAA